MVTRAAVKIDYWNHNTKQEVIIPCHRHCDAFQILHDFGFIKGVDFREKEQGFLNEKGKFLTRAEAWQEAKRCNQFLDSYIEEHIDDIVPPSILYSEDIW